MQSKANSGKSSAIPQPTTAVDFSCVLLPHAFTSGSGGPSKGASICFQSQGRSEQACIKLEAKP